MAVGRRSRIRSACLGLRPPPIPSDAPRSARPLPTRSSLAVPGLEFDLTPPVISGAVNRTVRAPKRAKRVRVRYSVSARDPVDGVVSASCKPRSGSRFKV